ARRRESPAPPPRCSLSGAAFRPPLRRAFDLEPATRAGAAIRLARGTPGRPPTPLPAPFSGRVPPLLRTGHGLARSALGALPGSAAHERASVRGRCARTAGTTPARDPVQGAPRGAGGRTHQRLQRRFVGRCPGVLVRRARARTDHSGVAGARNLLPALPARDVRLPALAHAPLSEAHAAGDYVCASARMTSSCSGKRPSRCLEKISLPSARTSNWLFSPETISASCDVFSLSSAARLAARRS